MPLGLGLGAAGDPGGRSRAGVSPGRCWRRRVRRSSGPFEAILRVTRKLTMAMTTMMRKSIQATAAARPKFFCVQPSW